MWQTPGSNVSPRNSTPRDSSSARAAARPALGPRRRDVLDVQRERVGVRLVLADTHLLGVVDVDRHVARLELGEVALGHVDRARQPKDLAVEVNGLLDVASRDGSEVDAG